MVLTTNLASHVPPPPPPQQQQQQLGRARSPAPQEQPQDREPPVCPQQAPRPPAAPQRPLSPLTPQPGVGVSCPQLVAGSGPSPGGAMGPPPVPISAPKWAGVRPGDWLCGRAKCFKLNFARRRACFKCNASRPPRPVEGEAELLGGTQREEAFSPSTGSDDALVSSRPAPGAFRDAPGAWRAAPPPL